MFTRTLQEEVKQKPLLGKSVGHNRYLYQQLFTRLHLAIAPTNLDIIVWDSNKQTKSTFADNFYEAFQSLFDQGYQSVIAVGNDCPSLSYRDLISAADTLQTNDFVIGPSQDGGVYLLGMNKEKFEPGTFKEIRWQTRYMRHDLINVIECDTYHCLPEKRDIDTYADLLEFSKNKYAYPLAMWLYLFFILFINNTLINHKINHQSILFSIHGLRAPPVFL